MKSSSRYTKPLAIILGSLIFLIGVSCEKEEATPVDNSLRVLSKVIDGEEFIDGISGISQDPSMEFIFSHSLNTAALGNAMTLQGPGGAVAITASYSNSNSTVSITTDALLEYDTEYSFRLPAGSYGVENEEFKTALDLIFTTAPFIPANVTLSSNVNTMSEDGGSAVVTVSLSEEVSQTVTVTLGFGGTATAGSDYNFSSNSIQFEAGQTSATVDLTAIQDSGIEGTELIEVSIESVVNAEELTPQFVNITLLDDDIDSNGDGTPDQGFIINEVLFDPPSGDAGDANGDGIRSPSEDEFIEFVNDSDVDIDLSGFTLYDAENLQTLNPNHTFPEGTIIPALGVYVLFGGGSPAGDFGGADVGVSTSSDMNLNNADDVITILDRDMNVFLTFDTQVEGAGISFGDDQSVTRIPDINGSFGLHKSANPDLAFSPGKQADGSIFPGGSGNPGAGLIVNEVLFDPPADEPGDANGDGIRSASEDEFIEFINDSDEALDLSGFRLFDETNLKTLEPRHIFPDGTIIPPHGVYVLFGGGMPMGTFGGAQVGVSTTGNMNLSNASDIITILDLQDNVVLTFDSSTQGAGIDFGADQSVTRSPDIDGGFDLHTNANGALLFSPGTRTDGSSF